MEADGVISSLAILVVVLTIWGTSQQRAVNRLNQLMDQQRQDIMAILADRDGWRDVARGLQLIAEASQDTTDRAAAAVEKVASLP